MQCSACLQRTILPCAAPKGRFAIETCEELKLPSVPRPCTSAVAAAAAAAAAAFVLDPSEDAQRGLLLVVLSLVHLASGKLEEGERALGGTGGRGLVIVVLSLVQLASSWPLASWRRVSLWGAQLAGAVPSWAPVAGVG